MKSVTTAADIWSVGCLAVELLTGTPASRGAGCMDGKRDLGVPCLFPRPWPACWPTPRGNAVVHPPRSEPCTTSGCLSHPPTQTAGSPPYYELQPMSALYNIVQDKRPPLPAGISAGMLDFLVQCFQKVGPPPGPAEGAPAPAWPGGSGSRSPGLGPLEGLRGGCTHRAAASSRCRCRQAPSQSDCSGASRAAAGAGQACGAGRPTAPPFLRPARRTRWRGRPPRSCCSTRG